ncbi:MAG TPA: phage holin family protein [Actinomycetes bacterium]|nr:phage holin family protein [Actinomycetes bacterium]
MKAFFIKVLAAALALWVATLIVPRIELEGSTFTDRLGTLLIVAIIFGVVNAIAKPIAALFSLPLIVLTLGLFLLVLNALMLLLTNWIAGLLDLPFDVDGFWAAFWGAIVISIVTFVVGLFVGDARRD